MFGGKGGAEWDWSQQGKPKDVMLVLDEEMVTAAPPAVRGWAEVLREGRSTLTQDMFKQSPETARVDGRQGREQGDTMSAGWASWISPQAEGDGLLNWWWVAAGTSLPGISQTPSHSSPAAPLDSH
jgi:hypothetical protein